MKSHATDMTTGSPVGHIIRFALPALVGNIFQQIYNLADSIIVGRFVGANALAAVGATASITFLFFALCNGIASGGGIVVSQYYGAHENDKVKNCIINTGLIMLMIPLLFGIIGYVCAPALLTLMSTPAEILPDAVLYIRCMCVGLLFVSLYNYVAGMLRALGDSRSPLYFLILSTVINVVLDIVLVYFLKMGVRGAAYATVLAQFISVVSCSLYAMKTNPYFRFRKKDFNISGAMLYKILHLGVPMSLQFAMIAVSGMAVQRVANSYGTLVVAAFTATNRIEQLIHQPYTTLGMSIATYCGQNFGAKKYDRVLAGYKKGLLIMACLSVVMIAVMQFFGDNIMRLFVSDPQVVSLGAAGLRITSLFYLVLGLIYVVRGVLTGIGDAFFALLNGFVEVLGRFTVPLIITQYMGSGAIGIWIASGIVWFLSGTTAWLRFITYTADLFGRKPRPVQWMRRGHSTF